MDFGRLSRKRTFNGSVTATDVAENRLVPRESNISGSLCLDDQLAVLRKLANERLPAERNEESEDRKANQRHQAENHLCRKIRREFRTQRDQQHDAGCVLNHDCRDEAQPHQYA